MFDDLMARSMLVRCPQQGAPGAARGLRRTSALEVADGALPLKQLRTSIHRVGVILRLSIFLPLGSFAAFRATAGAANSAVLSGRCAWCCCECIGTRAD